MKTKELIEALGRGPIAVDTQAATRRFGIAIGAGVAVSLAAMLALLGLRPDLAVAIAGPMFWMKVAIPAMLAVALVAAAARLSRPGGSARIAWLAMAALLLAVETAAVLSVAMAPAGERLPIVYVKVEGLSVAEASARSGMSESAIKVGIHRGLKRLAAMARGHP